MLPLQNYLNTKFKGLLSAAIPEQPFIEFKEKLASYKAILQTVDTTIEDNVRAKFIQFLEDSFPTYKNKLQLNVNCVDLAYIDSNNSQKQIELIFEFKSQSNNREMPTKASLKSKGLYECMRYYLNEYTRLAGKTQVKHIVITNGTDFFVCNGADFYSHFAENKKLIEDYQQFASKQADKTTTDYFYEKIAPLYVDDSLPYCYFNLLEEDAETLYHFFSPTVLLKQYRNNFFTTALNKPFYYELLYILGLKEEQKVEKKDEEKKVIKIVEANIASSFFECTKKEVLERFDNLTFAENYGFTKEEQLFSVTLELVITWINRILFLKLLEAQIVSFHAQDAGQSQFFLTTRAIETFNDLDYLFFKVLAVPYEEREAGVPMAFLHVPYLNSSLFEKTRLETELCSIRALGSYRAALKLFDDSVLKKGRNTATAELTLLPYLLQFLNSYQFNARGDGSNLVDNDLLINASVLGNIFEKVNGYAQGSFYTPSFITSYLTKETITRAFLNQIEAEHEAYYGSLSDIKQALRNRELSKADLKAILTNFKVIDPAVGSGHFLVSALNFMLYLYFYFNLLELDIDFELSDDELLTPSFHYKVANPKTTKVQQALFETKQFIIENNLFGVDVNPKSVAICQLRLWVELLKHTYYTKYQPNAICNNLVTLPNIDINIKTGNSLVYNFKFEGVATIESSIMKKYKKLVKQYYYCSHKDEKKQLKAQLAAIKQELTYSNAQFELFDDDGMKTQADLQLASLTTPLEWRLEFPAVLDDSGSFLGFNAVIGNPPYIQLQKLSKTEKELYKHQNYQTHAGEGDIYMLFYELGRKLLSRRGYLGFITSNSWMRTGYGKGLRTFFMEQCLLELLVNLGGVDVFENATVDTNLLIYTKSLRTGNHVKLAEREQGYNISKKEAQSYKNNLEAIVASKEARQIVKSSINFLVLNNAEIRLKAHIANQGQALKTFAIKILYGIKTGFNDAFYIDEETKEQLIAEDAKSAELIKPLLRGRNVWRWGAKSEAADQYMIATLPPLKLNIDDYPAIKNYLMQFYKELQQTGAQGSRKKTANAWFETQDTITYWEKFKQPKVIYPEISNLVSFFYDEDGWYINQKAFAITAPQTSLLKYLTGMFNSSVFFYFWQFCFSTLGEKGYEARKIFMQEVPVKKPTAAEEQAIVNLVDQIMAAKKSGQPVTELETALNQTVYQMYSLNAEQIELIEQFCATY